MRIFLSKSIITKLKSLTKTYFLIEAIYINKYNRTKNKKMCKNRKMELFHKLPSDQGWSVS